MYPFYQDAVSNNLIVLGT